MKVLAVAGVLSLAWAAHASGQTWSWTISEVNPNQSSTDAVNPNGSSGGRVNGLARASDGTTFYAASEWGGIFKSTDGGNNWSHVRAHVPQATWEVEVDPGNINRVYATSFYDGRVTSRAGINVSTNGGTTWTHPASATPPAGFCVDAARRTEPSAFGIAVDPANAARAFIGTNCGLARSTDSGATWTFIDPTPGDGGADDVWDVVVHDGGIIDLCGDDGHQRSTDNGATWTTATGAGLPAGRCSIAVSPDEANVLFAVNGTSLRESIDGGATWSAPFTNPGAQGRIPFAVVNQRSGAAFDLYFGDTQLWRTSCTTPAAGSTANRCPRNTWTTVQTGAHWDVGDLVFATGASDGCPALFSNDGGVYRNTLTTSPGCHTPNWEQATVSTKALWLFGMAGADQAGVDAEDLYLGNQDNGSFSSTDVPVASPAWVNPDCCDAHDLAAEGNRVVYSVCCFGGGRGNRVFVRNQGMTGGGELNTYPAGNVRAFSQSDSILRFAANSYALLTTAGVFVTSDIGASPVAWTQLGAASTPATVRHIQVAVSGGTPTFFVLSGMANGRTQDRLFRHAGAAAGGAWTQINPPGGTGGFGIFTVDPSNANRLMASHLRTGVDPTMVRSTDGGVTWTSLAALDTLMTGGGTFRYTTTRGPVSGLPFTAASTLGGYPQPTLLAYSPANGDVVVAGAMDAGVFLSFDGGTTWRLLTNPTAPTAARPHIPRPWYAYFDHEGGTILSPRFNLYVGTQGRGAWRFAFRRSFPIVDICLRRPALCRAPILERDLVKIRCADVPGCIVRDPIPKNCTVKYNCPGCPPGGLCPPYYHLFFDRLDPEKWDVALVTKRGGAVPHEVIRNGRNGVVVSFRPSRQMFRQGTIGDYEVVFALRDGAKGEDVDVAARVEVSDKPYRR